MALYSKPSKVDSSAWLSMWYSPRQTIRRIININPRHQIIPLAGLIGIYWTLSQLQFRNAGDHVPFPLTLVITVIGGPIVGIVILYLTGVLLHWTGNKLGGQASAEYLRAAFAWSWIPNIWTLFLWVPQLFLFGTELFTSAKPKISSSSFLALIFLALSILELIANLWSYMILLINISEVQRFSYWRALSSILLTLLIIFVPLFIILALVSGFY
jgi:hypothetical protein